MPTIWDAPARYRALIRVFFPRAAWNCAAGILMCESGGNPFAHNPSGEDSRGLYQINVGPGANPQYATLDLYDPVINVAVASVIYRGWGNWGPWRN